MSQILMVEQATPATPSAGQHLLYPKSDGFFYAIDSSGTERKLNYPISWAGAWSAGTYNLNDVVRNDGATWICTAASTVEEPTGSPVDWDLFLEDGATGATGAAGANGADGTSFTWQGAWAAGTYNLNDVVENDGSSWICTAASTVEEPTGIAVDWDLMAAAGAGGGGDVVGPASSTDFAVARWDGATGELLQDSDLILSDADVMTFPTGGAVLLDDSITAAGAALPLAFDGDADTGLFRAAADTLCIATGAVEAMRINESQVISFGTTVESVATSNSTVPKFIFAANGTAAVMQWIRHTTPGGGGPLIQFGSTRGTAPDSYTVLVSGDGIGTLNFMGTDGSDYTPAAQIVGQVDATPSNNDMPGRLIFATTPDGTASPTERMRIANGGNIYCTGAGTTGSAANAFLNSGSSPANELLRSTSSLRYKRDVEPILPEHFRKVLTLQPIWYRSLAKADNPDWSFYGLGAEEVAAIDPRLVNWGYLQEDYEWTVNEDGLRQPVLKEGATLKPDGVAYERLPVLMIPILADHESRIAAIEAQRRPN